MKLFGNSAKGKWSKTADREQFTDPFEEQQSPPNEDFMFQGDGLFSRQEGQEPDVEGKDLDELVLSVISENEEDLTQDQPKALRERRPAQPPREDYYFKDEPSREEAYDEAEDEIEARPLPGWAKGLLLVLVSLVILGATVYAVGADLWKTYVTAPIGTVDTQTDTGTSRKYYLTTNNFTGDSVQAEIPVSHKEDYYNILILGTDGDGTRTDTIMIARLDSSEHTVALMSVPRDTLVSGDYTVPKINSVYAANGEGEKGIMALEDTLEQILGFRVDAYLLVDLSAFCQMVDLVGGVDFDVPQDMHYEDPVQDLYIDLKEGRQHLDGDKAMQLVRFRTYPEADIERTRVQQDFCKALAKKCLSISTIAKINEFSNIFFEKIKTDMTVGNLVYLGVQLLDCDFDQMQTFTLEGDGVMINDGAYYQLRPQSVLDVVNGYFNPYETEIKPEDLQIRADQPVEN